MVPAHGVDGQTSKVSCTSRDVNKPTTTERETHMSGMFVTLVMTGKPPKVQAAAPGATTREILAEIGVTGEQANTLSITDSATGEDVNLDAPLTASATLIVGQAVAGA